MPEIKHMVVLMMENRSFDHLVGWLQSDSYQIDGLDGSQSNRDSSGEPVKVTRDANYSGDYTPDVAHDFLNVNHQVTATVCCGSSFPSMIIPCHNHLTGYRLLKRKDKMITHLSIHFLKICTDCCYLN